jgi:5-methylcytosine-specific restriction endonuclease McrA
MDHVHPKSKGGLTEWENIVVSCTDCNSYKANRTPEEAGMTLLRKPVKPRMNIFQTDHRVKDWETFLGIAYWNVPLDNDMDD